MSYNTYLFDFDYTLCDSSEGIIMSYQHVLHSHGYHDVSDDTIRLTIGKTLVDSFSIMTGVTDKDTLQQWHEEYVRFADTCMTQHTYFFPETKDVLLQLKEKGTHLGIISTKYAYRITRFMEQHFPTDFFDIVVGIESVKEPKPSPEGLLLAVRHVGEPLNRVLYLGDNVIDAQTARDARVDFCGILHEPTSKQDLEPYPHVALLPDLCGILSL